MKSSPAAAPQVLSPATPAEVADCVRAARSTNTPLFPVGGGTSPQPGLPSTPSGDQLSLAGLLRVVDYPWEDMTVTVESGVTLAHLRQTLAERGQWLPVEGGSPERATVGGLIATDFSGPRRYGYGTIRDYVIGIQAVDGHGTLFKAGGRVVKNVAGYDLCKLMCGSLGTLAVITQATLKVRPQAARSEVLRLDVPDLDAAERLLAALCSTQATPCAICLFAGEKNSREPALGAVRPAGSVRLCLGVDGSPAEVAWQTQQLASEFAAAGYNRCATLPAGEELWQELTDFPLPGGGDVVVRATMRPSGVCPWIAALLESHPAAAVGALAGSGVVYARLGSFQTAETSKLLISRLQPLAAQYGGNCTVVDAGAGLESSRRAVWGLPRADAAVLARVKREFDPANILNPGRFPFDL